MMSDCWKLDHGERDTDNLSPWPGVAKAGEKMNRDEFMRRTLELAKNWNGLASTGI
jgi:hypothetical protein